MYSAALDRQQARQGALSQVLSRFFNGSREALVMDLLGHEEVGADEIARVKALLDRHDTSAPAPGRRRA